MSRKAETIGPGSALVEAVRLMQSTGHGALPVVDENGGLPATISAIAILNRCRPEYGQEAGDLYGTRDFAPLLQTGRLAGIVGVQDVTDGIAARIAEGEAAP
jgi:CBS domain-containing protein